MTGVNILAIVMLFVMTGVGCAAGVLAVDAHNNPKDKP